MSSGQCSDIRNPWKSEKLEWNITNFAVSTVAANGLALPVTKTSAVTVTDFKGVKTTLVQLLITACMTAPCHYQNHCWYFVHWVLGNKLLCNLNQNSKFFCCLPMSILFSDQCVNGFCLVINVSMDKNSSNSGGRKWKHIFPFSFTRVTGIVDWANCLLCFSGNSSGYPSRWWI